MCYQTTNPKKGHIWNDPKKSTYARFGGAMFLDQYNHVVWQGISEYDDTHTCEDFLEYFIDVVPEAGQKIVRAWVKAKQTYDARKTKEMDTAAAASAAIAAAKEMNS